jgi:putative endonuclease
MNERSYYVYILSSTGYVLYTGVTNNLIKRVHDHKNKVNYGFSNKYKTDKLVYYEMHSDVTHAIQREKNLKKWKREWKVNLIKEFNPDWKDLYYDL